MFHIAAILLQHKNMSTSVESILFIEIINNKARHILMDAKCRQLSNRLDGAVSFREPFGQTKVMQIRQGETLNHQGAITHEVCCLAAQQYCDRLSNKLSCVFILFQNFVSLVCSYLIFTVCLSTFYDLRIYLRKKSKLSSNNVFKTKQANFLILTYVYFLKYFLLCAIILSCALIYFFENLMPCIILYCLL